MFFAPRFRKQFKNETWSENNNFSVSSYYLQPGDNEMMMEYNARKSRQRYRRFIEDKQAKHNDGRLVGIIQPIRSRYLGHVTGYQPIRDLYVVLELPYVTRTNPMNLLISK